MGSNTKREVQRLADEIERLPGWRVARGRRGGKVMVYPPNGARAFSIHQSNSDYRWERNVAALLKQHGHVWEWRS